MIGGISGSSVATRPHLFRYRYFNGSTAQGYVTHSDKWSAYICLASLGYEHDTVNHHEHFVDLDIGAYILRTKVCFACIPHQLLIIWQTASYCVNMPEFVGRPHIAVAPISLWNKEIVLRISPFDSYVPFNAKYHAVFRFPLGCHNLS